MRLPVYLVKTTIPPRMQGIAISADLRSLPLFLVPSIALGGRWSSQPIENGCCGKFRPLLWLAYPWSSSSMPSMQQYQYQYGVVGNSPHELSTSYVSLQPSFISQHGVTSFLKCFTHSEHFLMEHTRLLIGRGSSQISSSSWRHCEFIIPLTLTACNSSNFQIPGVAYLFTSYLEFQ